MKSLFFVNSSLQGESPPSWFTHLGFGVFETMRVRSLKSGGQVLASIFGWQGHMDRLLEGAAQTGCYAPAVDDLLKTVQEACSAFDWRKFTDARLRIVLLEKDFVLSLEPWSPVLNVNSGIEAILCRTERVLPEIKSCSAIPSVLARQKLKNSTAREAFLVDRDDILREGSWSNFFWVDKIGTLVTPADGILNGVTRSVVLSLASLFMKVRQFNAQVKEILTGAAEAFMTQTSHGIVPVIRIDDSIIGDGSPGPYTKSLITRYNTFVSKSGEPFTKTFRVA